MSRAVVRVPSMRKVGLTYEVELDRDDDARPVACDCPAFAVGKRRGQPCKHMRLYAFATTAVRRCQEKHNGDGHERLCLWCLIDLLAAVARKRRSAPEDPRRKRRAKKSCRQSGIA